MVADLCPASNIYNEPANTPDDSLVLDTDSLVHVECWLPAKRIDLIVLATYLEEFVDNSATLEVMPTLDDCRQPRFMIGTRSSMSVKHWRDVVDDTRAWKKERTSREYQEDPYSFAESDVWQHRKRLGADQNLSSPRHRGTVRSQRAHHLEKPCVEPARDTRSLKTPHDERHSAGDSCSRHYEGHSVTHDWEVDARWQTPPKLMAR